MLRDDALPRSALVLEQKMQTSWNKLCIHNNINKYILYADFKQNNEINCTELISLIGSMQTTVLDSWSLSRRRKSTVSSSLGYIVTINRLGLVYDLNDIFTNVYQLKTSMLIYKLSLIFQNMCWYINTIPYRHINGVDEVATIWNRRREVQTVFINLKGRNGIDFSPKLNHHIKR